MRALIVVFLLLLSTISAAADRTAKIRTLMEAQGLLGMMAQQIDMGKQQAREQARQMLDQFTGTLAPPPEFNTRFRRASEEFVAALEPPWGAQEIVDVWARIYGPQFTDDELDQLIAFYLSPLGKKDVAVSQKALPEFARHFDERFKPILDKATKKYISDLQQIAKECCRK